MFSALPWSLPQVVRQLQIKGSLWLGLSPLLPSPAKCLSLQHSVQKRSKSSEVINAQSPFMPWEREALFFSGDWIKTVFMWFSVFCLLTSTPSFSVTSFFMGSLCGVHKCFNVKYLRLEVIDSIRFGLLACALISLLCSHLLLCKFFNVLFFALQMLSLGTYTVILLGQQDLILWRIFVSVIVLSGFAPIPFVLSLLFAF